MNLKPIKQNMNELQLLNGARILINYQTPVAYIDSNNVGRKTSKFWSKTTSRHINSWLGSLPFEVLPQTFFDRLLEEVKL